jgi:formamidopyrimidine-DNA glycosylase
MPELAEVEYFRKRWDAGLGKRILAVKVHAAKRIFFGTNVRALTSTLTGARLISSQAHGKWMAFRFSKQAWLGLHLGMTGELHSEGPEFRPARHDHLVLYQKERALVFTDPRLFGRVRFYRGAGVPDWWSRLPASLTSESFTPAALRAFLQRHRAAPIKAVLLLQSGFPGVGNWMADEILWRAGLHPGSSTERLSDAKMAKLWHEVRNVCRQALKHVSPDFSDPPRGWLFHQRWEKGGRCPKDSTPLMRGTIGGRTTAWCPKCQGAGGKQKAESRKQKAGSQNRKSSRPSIPSNGAAGLVRPRPRQRRSRVRETRLELTSARKP